MSKRVRRLSDAMTPLIVMRAMAQREALLSLARKLVLEEFPPDMHVEALAAFDSMPARIRADLGKRLAAGFREHGRERP